MTKVKFTKEELEYISYLIMKYRPQDHIAFVIFKKIGRAGGEIK